MCKHAIDRPDRSSRDSYGLAVGTIRRVSPHFGDQVLTPAVHVVQAGVLKHYAGQHHAEQRRQATDLGDQLAGQRACDVHQEYGRQAAAGHGHLFGGHVNVQQTPSDGHGRGPRCRVGHRCRQLVVAPSHGGRVTAAPVELHAGVVLPSRVLCRRPAGRVLGAVPIALHHVRPVRKYYVMFIVDIFISSRSHYACRLGNKIIDLDSGEIFIEII